MNRMLKLEDFEWVNEEVLNWIKEVVREAKEGRLPVITYQAVEWTHDKVMLHIQGVNPKEIGGVTYEPLFSLFYESMPNETPINGWRDPRSCEESGEFAFSLLQDDRGTYDYFLAGKNDHAELFKDLCQLVKKHFVKREVYSKDEAKYKEEKALKETLEPLIYERYRAVMNSCVLRNTPCSMVAKNQDYQQLMEGSLTECLTTALQEIKENEVLEIWIEIGQTTYIFATFEKDETTKLINQYSLLPIQTIKAAQRTVKALDDYQQDFILHGWFDPEEILNSTKILSNKTYLERLHEKDTWTVFEGVAEDIRVYGTPEEAIKHHLLDGDYQMFNDHKRIRILILHMIAIHSKQ